MRGTTMLKSESLAPASGLPYDDFKQHTPIGLTMTVARSTNGCSYPGHLSSIADRVTLVGWFHANDIDSIHRMPREAMVVTPHDTAPAVLLRIRNGGGIRQDRSAVIVPADDHCNTMLMASGNFAYSSDTRVSTLVRDLIGFDFYGALPLHDWER